MVFLLDYTVKNDEFPIVFSYLSGYRNQEARMSEKVERNPISARILRGLGEIQCTDDEICAVLGITLDELEDELANTPGLQEAFDAGRASSKKSLRRIQWDIAKKGNVKMAIWLGRQWLDQLQKDEKTQSSDVQIEVAYVAETKDAKAKG